MCLLNQAREKDRANYTCVAENVANRRLSPPARLNVHGKLANFYILSFRPVFFSWWVPTHFCVAKTCVSVK